MKISVGALRSLILEELAEDPEVDYDYGIPPNTAQCPSVKQSADIAAGVEVPDTENWQQYIKFPVPLVHQASSFSCGASALMSLFLYWQPDGYPYETETDMWEALETTEDNGTEPRKIVQVARDNGLQADYYTNMTIEDVRGHYDSGATVILCFQAWPGRYVKDWLTDWEDGHYAVLVGMDETNVYLMDPSTHNSYVWLPINELITRWHDVDEGVPKFGLGIVVNGDKPRQVFPGTLKRLC